MRRRAAPALIVEVRHFGWWRAGLLLVGAAWVGSWTAWAGAHGGGLMAAGVAALSAILAAAVVRAHWQADGVQLRWDGQHWHWRLREPDRETRGRADVALDLGSWLLLRLRPDLPDAGHRWLPIQRKGLERRWHELRCAVYSPTSAADPRANLTASTA